MIGEAVVGSLQIVGCAVGTAASVAKKTIIDGLVRPDYWSDPAAATKCTCCDYSFSHTNKDKEFQLQDQHKEKALGLKNDTFTHTKKSEENQIECKDRKDDNKTVKNIMQLEGKCTVPVPARAKVNCRACGSVVCEECGKDQQPVPEMGWKKSVPVCRDCACKRVQSRLRESVPLLSEELCAAEKGVAHELDFQFLESDEWASAPTPMFRGQQTLDQLEGVCSVVGQVVAPLMMTTGRLASRFATSMVRPAYWRKDCDVTECHVCRYSFRDEYLDIHVGERGEQKHHCRNCGEGVCGRCSKNMLPVPQRGWQGPVRVCDQCFTALSPDLELAQNVDHDHDHHVTVHVKGQSGSSAKFNALTLEQ